MRDTLKKVSRVLVFMIIILIGTILGLAACSRQAKVKDNLNTITDKSSEQMSKPDKKEDTVYPDNMKDNPNLPIIIPAEWKDKYTTTEAYATYFNGEEEYIETSVTKYSYLLRPDIKKGQSYAQGPFLDITLVPKEEMINYLNWGMKGSYFFLGYNDEYYYLSSGAFGIPKQQDNMGGLECFRPIEIERVVKESFSQNGILLYWDSLVLDADTVHGRNNNLPFEMNIQYLYDIEGSYEYTDETGVMPIEDITHQLLQKFADDLCIPHDNWRFTIDRCEMVVYDTLYHKDNQVLLSESMDLQDFYLKGDLDEYLGENCWIFVSGCKVYDYQGFLSMLSSREFRVLSLEYIGAEAGVWVIEKKDETYRMFRPDIPFVGQGA